VLRCPVCKTCLVELLEVAEPFIDELCGIRPELRRRRGGLSSVSDRSLQGSLNVVAHQFDLEGLRHSPWPGQSCSTDDPAFGVAPRSAGFLLVGGFAIMLGSTRGGGRLMDSGSTRAGGLFTMPGSAEGARADAAGAGVGIGAAGSSGRGRGWAAKPGPSATRAAALTRCTVFMSSIPQECGNRV
jgi:hypothetical protein